MTATTPPRSSPVAPTPATLKRYGLTAIEWLAILARQGNVCAICRKAPTTGRWVTDHEHVRGWKLMPDHERKRFVRGVLCWFCNHTYVGRAITVTKAKNVVSYLEAYESRKASGALASASG